MRRSIRATGSSVLFSSLVVLLLTASPLAAADPAGIEFFEKHIRPVLAEHCYKCHGADADNREAGLRLDLRDAMRRGGDSGPAVVPGDPGKSLLLASIRGDDPSRAMPPDGRLPKETVARFEKWIRMGAPDPRDEADAADRPSGNDPAPLWSFQSPRRHLPPPVEDRDWPSTTIDRFVLHRLEARGLKPVRDAHRRVLIRRLYFDLIGLPPAPRDVERFLKDRRATAWEEQVDRLLASPQFGERWGRHWLDVVRFAESSGQEFNFSYPHAWPYRDYVIDSFNLDRPYDQFVRQQLAGDLMPRAGDARDDPQQIATALLACGPKRHNSGGTQFRMDIVDDQIDVTCRALLGLTVACARCHDHKFDPIPTRDYYALAGIFMSTEPLYGTIKQKYSNNPTPVVPIGPDGRQRHQAVEDHRRQVEALAKQVATAEEALKKLEQAADKTKQLAAASGSGNAGVEGQSAEERDKQAARGPETAADSADAGKQKTQREELEARLSRLRGELETLKKQAPKPPPYTIAARDREKPADVAIAVRGNLSKRGDIVPRGFLSNLPVADAPPVDRKQSGRLQLAQWITSRHNPLTARVMVNRIWHHLFGRGLVETVDNFGTLGRKPSHPELLDTLAVDFMEQGWSVKRTIRAMVLSHVYRLSTVPDARAVEVDPDNVLLWRMRPRRLEAEAIRDAMLAVSGQLDLSRPTGSPVTALGDRLVRDVPLEKLQPPSRHRSVYLPVVRDYLPELFQVFDFADPSLVVGRRAVTTVPSQALFLRNSRFALEQATAMARRLLARKDLDDPARIDWAYELAFARPAMGDERAEALGAIARLTELAGRAAIEKDAGAAEKKAGAAPRRIAWTAFCQALMAGAEFRYLVE